MTNFSYLCNHYHHHPRLPPFQLLVSQHLRESFAETVYEREIYLYSIFVCFVLKFDIMFLISQTENPKVGNPYIRRIFISIEEQHKADSYSSHFYSDNNFSFTACAHNCFCISSAGSEMSSLYVCVWGFPVLMWLSICVSSNSNLEIYPFFRFIRSEIWFGSISKGNFVLKIALSAIMWSCWTKLKSLEMACRCNSRD